MSLYQIRQLVIEDNKVVDDVLIKEDLPVIVVSHHQKMLLGQDFEGK